jgi:lipopolysaccharide biosynthesis protein
LLQIMNNGKRFEPESTLQKVFCFYLPQFHRVEENSRWWGPGFTEWTNVSKARPVFPGHTQPLLPADLGFYDLDHIEAMSEQAALASKYGVSGFVFYFYSFDGQRILEKPVENYLNSTIALPYMICWANENWTRTWDGSANSVLMPQNYEPGFEATLYSQFRPYFQDERYERHNGMPILIIYRAQDMPDPRSSLEILRKLAKSDGFEGLYIAAVASFGLKHPGLVGADALIEFPPHDVGHISRISSPRRTSRLFRGQFFDLPAVALNSTKPLIRDFDYYRGAIPSWDNTARRPLSSNVFLGASPLLFEKWLRYLRSWSNNASERRGQANLLFINAWNEWAEGAVIEPDIYNGRKNLEAVKESTRASGSGALHSAMSDLDGFVRGITSYVPIKANVSQVRVIFFQLRVNINRETFKAAWRLLKEDPTGRRFMHSVMALTRFKERSQADPFPINESLTVSTEAQVLLVCHIHYQEYIQDLSRYIQANPKVAHVLITCTDPEIYDLLNSEMATSKVPFEVHLIENRGRNFQAVFVTARNLIESGSFAYVSHLHSKRTPQASEKVMKAWSARLWDLGLRAPSLLARACNIMELDQNIDVCHANVDDLIKPWNMTWGANGKIGKQLARKLGISLISLRNKTLRIDYPAGGMFIARASYLRDLLAIDLQPSDFPSETGQTDATLQHALERLIGVVAHESGHDMIQFDFQSDKFFRLSAK